MSRRGNLFIFLFCIILLGCSIVKLPYKVTKVAVKTTYLAGKTVYKTTQIVYKVGQFTFKVVKAPIDWALTHEDIESIDGLPPREAIAKGKVKCSPYVVHGKKYYPYCCKKARGYKEKGIASYYGYETLRRKGGHMTANGEVFDPHQLTAAHRLLPLPSYVKVTNLANGKSIIARVNDRGPFVKGRVIDLTLAGAKRLGFYKKGTTKVLVEALKVCAE
ncbi:MAG: septal ring lytic transglycosylase RlpA family protein [Deltaproteobacteria bacterium]|nr:septal ring lytic transglycosylase RlpA family protein [Deltaproteobacteria bacterium]